MGCWMMEVLGVEGIRFVVFREGGAGESGEKGRMKGWGLGSSAVAEFR